MVSVRTYYSQRQEQELWGLWLLFEISVPLVREEATQELLAVWCWHMILVVEGKLKSQRSQTTILVDKTKNLPQVSVKRAPDLADTHYIQPVSLLATSMGGPLPQIN